jgi:hypothetical protein
MEQYKRVYAAIDLDAIEYNLKSIKNNINICIVEVPNETAPSIQGFAKPPA